MILAGHRSKEHTSCSPRNPTRWCHQQKYIHLSEIAIHTFTTLQNFWNLLLFWRGIPLLNYLFFWSLFRGAISRITFSIAVIAWCPTQVVQQLSPHSLYAIRDVGASVVPSSRAQPKQTNKHKQQTINGILQDCSNQHLNCHTHRCLRTQTSHNHEGTAVCIAQYLWNECIRNPFVVEDPLPKTWTPQNPHGTAAGQTVPPGGIEDCHP